MVVLWAYLEIAANERGQSLFRQVTRCIYVFRVEFCWASLSPTWTPATEATCGSRPAEWHPVILPSASHRHRNRTDLCTQKETAETTACYFYGEVTRQRGGFHLTLSGVTYSGESQLPCDEDTPAAPWGGPRGKKPRLLPTAMNEPPCKWVPQAQPSLYITTGQRVTS